MAKIKARSSLDSSGFRSGVGEMGNSVKGFSTQLGGLKAKIGAAFAVGFLIRFGRKAIQLGSDLSDLAVQVGLNTDQFQTLEFSALKAGTAPDKIRTALAKLGISLGQARDGMSTYTRLLELAGISSEDLKNIDLVGALEKIAKTVQENVDGSKEMSAVWQLLGTRSGLQLREVLLEIANEGLPAMTQAARDAGQVMDAELVQSLDNANDELQIFERRMLSITGVTLNFIRIAAKGFLDFLFPGKQKSDELLTNQEVARQTAAAAATKDRKESIALTLRLKNAEIELGKTLKENFKASEAFGKDLKQIAKDEIKAAKDLKREEDKRVKLREKLNDLISGKGVTISPEVSDRLARIGGTTGGQISPELRQARRQIRINEQIRDFIAKNGNKLAQIEVNTAMGGGLR